MKNKEEGSILVINNLPSNIVKEAIVLLRKDYQFEKEENKFLKENIMQEAEDVIYDYVKSSEKKKEEKNKRKLSEKYKISKRINIALIFILFLLIMEIIICQ